MVSMIVQTSNEEITSNNKIFESMKRIPDFSIVMETTADSVRSTELLWSLANMIHRARAAHWTIEYL